MQQLEQWHWVMPVATHPLQHLQLLHELLTQGRGVEGTSASCTQMGAELSYIVVNLNWVFYQSAVTGCQLIHLYHTIHWIQSWLAMWSYDLQLSGTANSSCMIRLATDMITQGLLGKWHNLPFRELAAHVAVQMQVREGSHEVLQRWSWPHRRGCSASLVFWRELSELSLFWQPACIRAGQSR